MKGIVENDNVYFIGTVVLIFFVFITLIQSKHKSAENYQTKKNQSIIDCQSRGNDIDWCLEILNK